MVSGERFDHTEADGRDSIGQMIKIIRESHMEFVVDKLIDFSAGKDEELRDISALGTFPPISFARLH